MRIGARRALRIVARRGGTLRAIGHGDQSGREDLLLSFTKSWQDVMNSSNAWNSVVSAFLGSFGIAYSSWAKSSPFVHGLTASSFVSDRRWQFCRIFLNFEWTAQPQVRFPSQHCIHLEWLSGHRVAHL